MADPREIARQAARKYGLPEDVFLGQLEQESGWKQGAKSHAGAMGYAQLMPGTAKELGVTNPYDPHQNIDGGARYMARMLKKYNGNVQHALTAYNWGPGNMDAYLRTGRGAKGQSMPAEARNYATGIFRRSKNYGGSGEGADNAFAPEVHAANQFAKPQSATAFTTPDAQGNSNMLIADGPDEIAEMIALNSDVTPEEQDGNQQALDMLAPTIAKINDQNSDLLRAKRRDTVDAFIDQLLNDRSTSID